MAPDIIYKRRLKNNFLNGRINVAVLASHRPHMRVQHLFGNLSPV
jgi:hypothetical protein